MSNRADLQQFQMKSLTEAATKQQKRSSQCPRTVALPFPITHRIACYFVFQQLSQDAI